MREAPALEQFARDHGEEVRIIGLGTQDSLGMAEDFVARFGVESIQMLWDPSFESWAALGVRGQPSFLLLDRNGAAVSDVWYGSADPEDVLAAVRQL